MEIIQDDIWLCADCMFAAVNGDYSGIAYYYDPDEDEEKYAQRIREIQEGLRLLGPGLVPDLDPHPGDEFDCGEREFSWRPCDCCGSSLGGSRYRFVILG